MKKTTLIILCFVTLSGFGQSIKNPGVVLDTTYHGSRFIYEWNLGQFSTQAVDSGSYFSLNGSNIELTLTKKRIVGVGDTLIKTETIQIRFADIRSALACFFSDLKVKKAIKEALEPNYKIKVSQE